MTILTPINLIPALQSCSDVPGTKPTMQGGVLTCVPINKPVQGGSFGSMNVQAFGDSTWLWIAGGLLLVILLSGGKRGRR